MPIYVDMHICASIFVDTKVLIKFFFFVPMKLIKLLNGAIIDAWIVYKQGCVILSNKIQFNL